VRAGYAVEEGRGDTQMTLDAMRAHIDRLIANLRVTRFHFADDLDIRWIDDREEAMAITDADPVEIHLPHIRSTLDYATCLHELGHVNGRYQGSASSKTRERWAWRYAREHALVWTAEMEEDARASMWRP
jgi:hypothetical protein